MNYRLVISTLLVLHVFTVLSTYSQLKDIEIGLLNHKNSTVKSNIVFPPELHTKYSLFHLKNSTVYAPSLRFPFLIDDSTKQYGSIKITVHKSIESTYAHLLQFLNELSNPFTPPKITEGSLVIGDIAFGEIKNGILFLVFTRNNVLVWIKGPTDIVMEIARNIEKEIDLAPVLGKVTEIPSFSPF
jgi:hypothetical protein